MMAYLQDETGITLTEVLAVIVLLALVTTLLTAVASQMFTVRNVQETKIKVQRIANSLVADFNTLSNETVVNAKSSSKTADADTLGESGKYRYFSGFHGNEPLWNAHYKKLAWVVDPTLFVAGGPQDSGIYMQSAADNGIEKVVIARPRDESVVNTYQTPKGIKLKIHQVKNKHEDQVLKQGESNYRDSFSVQTTVYIVFYKGYINWRNYISDNNAPMRLDEAKRDNSTEIVYSRVFDVSYRDDAKSAGEVAGNGRW